MASLHTGSLNQHTELVRIETDLFNLYIQGKPYHPTVETFELHRDHEGKRVDARFHISHASSLTIDSVQLFSPDEGKMIGWSLGDQCAPIFYETQSYELVIEKKYDDDSIAFYHENVHIRSAVKPLGKRILSGILNFQNEIGYTELEIRHDGRTVLMIQLEIFPSKIDYKEDYIQLLQDVNEQIYNLSFDFLRKTYHLTGLRETQHQSLTEFYTILQHIFQQFIRAVERIQVHPHSHLQVENKIVDVNRVKKAGKANIAFLRKRPYLLQHDERHGVIHIQGKHYLPAHVLESRRKINYDTLENRFVRWVIIRIFQKLKTLRKELDHFNRTRDPQLMSKIQTMQNRLQRILLADFLQVGELRQISISLVLQMAPGYREVYRFYLMLMKGLSIQSDLFRISLKDLAQLYEYWCFLKIHQLISRKYELVSQDLIKVNRTGIFVRLDRSESAKMVYRNAKNGEIFTLYYNKLPPGDRSVTLPQRPDNILTLKKNDSSVEYKYIFDAKYRVNPAYEGTSYYDKYKTPGPEEEDINTMHRYRDAIVYADELNGEYERSMFGAYVLFPYHDEEQYREHPFYKSIELINVGAFPFLPNATRLVEKFLDEIIMDSPEKAYERSTRPRGTEEYYVNKISGKNVLVGSLRTKNQLDQALQHRIYHTPLKNITDHKILTQLEFVALYQSLRRFGEDGEAGIRYYGRIIDWKVVQRRQITQIPLTRNNPDELYVVFTIDEWLLREKPIIPGGHGIYRVLYTSKYIFDRAHEVAELRLDTEEQLKEWREKRRRGQVKVKLDQDYVDLANKVLAIEGQE